MTVLVLRALGLGDALAAVPALRGLRRAYPGRPLVLAAAGAPALFLAVRGLVDDVVPTAGLDDAPPGRAVGPHLAVNLHGCGPASHRLLLAGRPEQVVAFASPEADVAGPAWRDAEHEVHRWCRLVCGAGGHCEPADLLLAAPDRHPPRTGPVVVHPGATSAERRWPVPRFAAVARALAADGHPVVVTGSRAEADLVAGVVAGAGLPARAGLAGRLDLEELAALVASARLVVCGDTGVAHLATALGTPSVLLFGPVPPSRWGPAVDHDRHTVLWCASSPDGGLGGLEVAEVLSAARVMIDRWIPVSTEQRSTDRS